jgi:endonuclease/exonuclease/phosphatase family metal-dependent hydrolase
MIPRRWTIGLLSLAVLLLTEELPAQEGELLRVATFNVNYANRSYDQILAAVDELKADIICFQETTTELEIELERDLALSHPYFSSVGFRGQYLAERFAFASNLELTDIEYSPPKVGLFGCYRAKAKWAGRSIRIYNVHLTPVVVRRRTVNAALAAFEDAESKHGEEVKGLLSRLDHEEPTIVAGDFNSISTSVAPRSFVDAGWVDSFASKHKDADMQPSWKSSIRSIGKQPVRKSFAEVDQIIFLA